MHEKQADDTMFEEALKVAQPYGENGDLIVSVEHFYTCPVQNLGTYDRNRWSYSRGGWGLRGYEWTIDVWRKRTPEDLSQLRWVLPESLRSLIDQVNRTGRQAKANEIGSAISSHNQLDNRQLQEVEYALSKLKDQLEHFSDSNHDEWCSEECTIDSPKCEEMEQRAIVAALSDVVNPPIESIWNKRLTSHAERVFFEEFSNECKRVRGLNSGRGLMDHLLNPEYRKSWWGGWEQVMSRTPTHDELKAVAAFAQWLGTNCGQAYMIKCEARIKEIEGAERVFRNASSGREFRLTERIGEWVDKWMGDLLGDKSGQHRLQKNRIQGQLEGLVACVLWLHDKDKYADEIETIAGREPERHLQRIVDLVCGHETAKCESDLSVVFDPIAMGA